MSPITDARLIELLRFPRASGDEPEVAEVAYQATSFSPRERG